MCEKIPRHRHPNLFASQVCIHSPEFGKQQFAGLHSNALHCLLKLHISMKLLLKGSGRDGGNHFFFSHGAGGLVFVQS